MHIIIAFILYAMFTTKHSNRNKSQAGYNRAVWLSHSFSRDGNYKR